MFFDIECFLYIVIHFENDTNVNFQGTSTMFALVKVSHVYFDHDPVLKLTRYGNLKLPAHVLKIHFLSFFLMELETFCIQRLNFLKYLYM